VACWSLASLLVSVFPLTLARDGVVRKCRGDLVEMDYSTRFGLSNMDISAALVHHPETEKCLCH
jgi:hypothetical protein